MISLDSSILPAIFIFLVMIFTLNHLLYRPLLKIQSERNSRTKGVVDQAKKNLEYHLALFEQYQATIKSARMDGYRLQEEARFQATTRRNEALTQAKREAEGLLESARKSIQLGVQSAKLELQREAGEIARGIAATVLHRGA
jgi:F-type H+-transporting ATPase subunit b